jgi:hypothetical protein
MRLGDALVWAGRGEEAARAYLEAAEGAPERMHIEQAAAEQLLACGRIDEGAQVLHRVLADAGIRAPRSALSALFWLIVYRLWLALFGVRFEERNADDIRRHDRARIDALWAASLGFAMVDTLLGGCMQSRHVIEALRSGDRLQVLRATILEATYMAAGGQRQGKTERALVDAARRLANKDETGEGKPFFLGALGVAYFLRGRLKDARATLDEAIANFPKHRAGWQANAYVFRVYSLIFLGEMEELGRQHSRLLADAEERGDLYLSVQLRVGSPAYLWLAEDDPDAARRHTREGMARWSNSRYLSQHWQAMYGEASIELYVGNAALAYERIERDARALAKTVLAKASAHLRAMSAFLRGRCAIASLDAGGQRGKRLAEAQSLAHALEREHLPYADVFGSLLRAAAANATADRPGTVVALRAAIQIAEGADMALYAESARLQLGSLLAGDEGRSLVEEARRAMTARGVRAPSRFATMLLPGDWGALREA